MAEILKGTFFMIGKEEENGKEGKKRGGKKGGKEGMRRGEGMET